jgi:hypothetical protein
MALVKILKHKTLSSITSTKKNPESQEMKMTSASSFKRNWKILTGNVNTGTILIIGYLMDDTHTIILKGDTEIRQD